MGAAEILTRIVEGRGVLDLRALFASLVGPHRLALGRKQLVTLQGDRPTELYRNIGGAAAVAFVGVSLPGGAPALTVPAFMSQENQSGAMNTVPVNLLRTMLGGTYFPDGFTQILLPGEQLYGQLDVAGGAPASQQVLVASVIF